MQRGEPFPWADLLPMCVVGLPSLLIALACTLLLASYLGPRYDLLIVNGRVLGGTEDQLILVAVGSVFGSAAVFCALRIWHRVAEWRR